MNAATLFRITLRLLVLCLFPVNASATLPKPIQAYGIILAIDPESQTLVFKPAAGTKLLLMNWNKHTEFKKDGQPTSVTELKPNAVVSIYYKDLSFHHPLLTKVFWSQEQKTIVHRSAR